MAGFRVIARLRPMVRFKLMVRLRLMVRLALGLRFHLTHGPGLRVGLQAGTRPWRHASCSSPVPATHTSVIACHTSEHQRTLLHPSHLTTLAHRALAQLRLALTSRRPLVCHHVGYSGPDWWCCLSSDKYRCSSAGQQGHQLRAYLLCQPCASLACCLHRVPCVSPTA